MESREIVRRAIEFGTPTRLPFFLGGSWSDKLSAVIMDFPNLIERLHMLHGFVRTLEDFYLEPEKTHRLLDIILEYKINHIDEAAKRFGDRVHGLFLTDDWGTQKNTFVSLDIFKEYFFDRYKILFDKIHHHGWHVILHSCGKINDFVSSFIGMGVDVMNMQQPRAYGIRELGAAFAGKVCFLTTVDIQSTLPVEDPEAIRKEAGELVKHWSTPQGGFIVFNYGDSEGIGVSDDTAQVMFKAFYDLREYWIG